MSGFIEPNFVPQGGTRFRQEFLGQLGVKAAAVEVPQIGAPLAALAQLNSPLAFANQTFQFRRQKLEELYSLINDNHLLHPSKLIQLISKRLKEIETLTSEYLRACRIGSAVLGNQKIPNMVRILSRAIDVDVPIYKQAKVAMHDLEQAIGSYQETVQKSLVDIKHCRLYFEECQRILTKFPNLAKTINELETYSKSRSLRWFNKGLISDVNRALALFNHDLPLRNPKYFDDPLEAVAKKLGISINQVDKDTRYIFLGLYHLANFTPGNLLTYLIEHSPRDVYSLVNINGFKDNLQPAYSVNGVNVRLRVCDWYGTAMANEFPLSDEVLTRSLRNINDDASNTNKFFHHLLQYAELDEESDIERPKSNHPFGLGAWSEFRALVSIFRYMEGQSLKYYGSNAKYELLGFEAYNQADSFFDKNKIDICLLVKDKASEAKGYIPLQIKYSNKAAKPFAKKYPNIQTMVVQNKSLDSLDLELQELLTHPKLVIPEQDFKEISKIPESYGQELDTRRALWKKHLNFDCCV